MKQNFFDQLDGGWGEVIANTYEKYNNNLIYSCGDYSIRRNEDVNYNDMRVFSSIDVSKASLFIELEGLILSDETNAFKIIPYTDKTIDPNTIELRNPSATIDISCHISKNGIINIVHMEFSLYNLDVYKYSDEYHDDGDVELLHTNSIHYDGTDFHISNKAYLNPLIFIDLLNLKYNNLVKKYPEYKNELPIILETVKQKIITVLDKNNNSL